jgi:SAM-dependent methyltransferase
MSKEPLLSWEKVPCDGCGSEAFNPLFEGTDLLLDLPGHFFLVQCSQCGLIRQNPRISWDSLKKYYPEDYKPYTKLITTERSILRRLDRRYGMWKRLHSIQRYKYGGRLLDVGCGTGIFLGEAHRSGRWELVGIEPTLQAAEYASKTLNIPCIPRRFNEVDMPEGSFDVLTMWNVLEHLENPIEDLRHAYQVLRPDGLLVLAIPNVDGIGPKLFGSYWMGWDLPRHLYLFPQKQLRKILEEIGFKWMDARCIAGGHSSFVLSLEFFLRARNIRGGIPLFMLKVCRSLPTRLVLSPIFFLADLFRQCSLITIFAQKKPDENSYD